MTDTLVGTEISQLATGTTLDGTEVIPADQQGVTVRITAQQIADLAGSGPVLGGTGAVDSVNGHVGVVVLSAADLNLSQVDNTSDATKNAAAVNLTNKTINGSLNTLLNVPQSAVTGLPAALGSVVNTVGAGLTLTGNTVALADTAVSAALYGSPSTIPQFTVDQQGRITDVNAINIVVAESAVTNLTTDLAAKAALASPTFTGTVTSPKYALTGTTGATTAVRWVGGTTSASPTSGTWLTGDSVIGSGGKIYICTAGGTPGTWVDSGAGSSGPPTGSAGGDLGGSGSTYPNPVIADGAVTLAKQANLAGLTIQGNSSGSAAAPQALNTTQVKTLLAITESDVSSLTADLGLLAPKATPSFTGLVTSAGGINVGGATIAVGSVTVRGGIAAEQGALGLVFVGTQMGGSATIDLRGMNGTPGAITPTLSGNVIGGMHIGSCFQSGSTTTGNLIDCAQFWCRATETHSPTQSGNAWDFYTTTNGTNVKTLALTLDNDGSATFRAGATLAGTLTGATNVLTVDGTYATVTGGFGAYGAKYVDDTFSPVLTIARGKTTGGFLAAGDTIGSLVFQGASNAGATTFLGGAIVRGVAEEVGGTGTSHSGSRVEVLTAPIGSATGAVVAAYDSTKALHLVPTYTSGLVTGSKFAVKADGSLWVNPQTYTSNQPATAKATINTSGNIGFNGKAAQALTGFAAPTATQARGVLADASSAATVLQTLAALIVDLRANGVIG